MGSLSSKESHRFRCLFHCRFKRSFRVGVRRSMGFIPLQLPRSSSGFLFPSRILLRRIFLALLLTKIFTSFFIGFLLTFHTF